MAYIKLYSIIIIAFFVLKAVGISANSNFPDTRGGYQIILAFDENTPEPENSSATIIENIKISLTKFSEKLWEASRNRFHVKSVDILIPSTWNGLNSTQAKTQSYDTATIKISSTANRPHAENPFDCGKPGQFIELPLPFFNNSESGNYGVHWKVLLNLWASYRWGVYEEHGHVGDLKYPYSYENPLTAQWEVTGCSNYPITGSYKDDESLSCSASDTLLNSSSTCRFIPDSLTNATTSLMHFHWIDSIVNFCDETNHQKLSLNRQNAFCDHKSVWEVIRETRDYQIVTSPVDTLPPVTFQIVQQSKKPSLYILLDRGKIEGSITLANLIPRELVNFLGDTTRRHDTVAAVGTFPDSQGEDGSVKEEIEWSTLGDNLDKFVDVIGNLQLNGPKQRNIAQAIMTAVDKIKAKAPPNGAVMLLVTYGAELSSFPSYMPEAELVNALNENGIIFNTIELCIANYTANAHFSELAKKTGGVYTVVSNYGEAQTSLGNFFWFMDNILYEDFKELRKNYRTLLKSSESVATFMIPKSANVSQQDNPGKVEVFFSTADDSLSASNFTVEGIDTAPTRAVTIISDSTFSKKQDWNEPGSKWTYFIGMQYENIKQFSQVTIRTNCLTCRGSILVRTDVIDDNVTNTTVEVVVNTDTFQVDLPSHGPVLIFVKILKSGLPVQHALVMAHITDINDGAITYIHLVDNGEDTPDKVILDGIYSGYFVPTRDGNYRISVLIQGDDVHRAVKYSKSPITVNERRYARLLPVDQSDMGCTGAQCDTTNLPADFMQTVDLLMNLQISGTASFSPEPTKITGFRVLSDANTVTLEWFAPFIPGSVFSVSSYDIRQSKSEVSLITDFENQEIVEGLVTKPGTPHSSERHQVFKPDETTFYAIRSVYKGRHSKLSTVESIIISQDTSIPPTTTTTTTSTSPSITTSTAPPITTTTSESSTSTTTATGSTSTTPEGTTGETGTLPPESTNPATSAPEEDKPWAKTGGGIAVITIAVIIAVALIIVAAYFILMKRRRADTAKINPPPQNPRTSTLA